MVKTPEDVFEILQKEYSFDSVFTSETTFPDLLDVLESCADLANVDWFSDYGASKGVLVFPELNFVIKIPFTGIEERIDHCGDCEHCCGDEECEECEYYNQESDMDYYDFSEAKFPGCDDLLVWDYCRKETWLYNEAKEWGIERCFAGTRLLGTIDNHPIYAQEKADIFSSICSGSYGNHTEQERASTKEACERINGWCFNVDWLTDFISYFGDEVFQKFMNFIKTYKISDLHTSNVGYVNDIPCLVDYSGYDG